MRRRLEKIFAGFLVGSAVLLAIIAILALIRLGAKYRGIDAYVEIIHEDTTETESETTTRVVLEARKEAESKIVTEITTETTTESISEAVTEKKEKTSSKKAPVKENRTAKKEMMTLSSLNQIQTVEQETQLAGVQAEDVAICDIPVSESDATILAQVMFNEAGGLPTTEIAMVGWTVLNRVDSPWFPNDVYSVVSAPAQFAWYGGGDTSLYWLAEDILQRYTAEKRGASNVGRVLPPDYLYFYGDGAHNYFYRQDGAGHAYSFGYASPYC